MVSRLICISFVRFLKITNFIVFLAFIKKVMNKLTESQTEILASEDLMRGKLGVI